MNRTNPAVLFEVLAWGSHIYFIILPLFTDSKGDWVFVFTCGTILFWIFYVRYPGGIFRAGFLLAVLTTRWLYINEFHSFAEIVSGALLALSILFWVVNCSVVLLLRSKDSSAESSDNAGTDY